jgi:hypothetical protein
MTQVNKNIIDNLECCVTENKPQTCADFKLFVYICIVVKGPCIKGDWSVSSVFLFYKYGK